MKVKMTRDQAGCEDGITPRLYRKGQEYDLPSRLAGAFINDLKAAELIGEKMIRSSPMDKEMKGAPKNEFAKIVPEAPSPPVLTKVALIQMNREQLMGVIKERELNFHIKANWSEETIVKRIIEALGL